MKTSYRRPTASLLIILTVLLTLSVTATASVYRNGDIVRLTNLHRIDDDLYVIAKSDITLDGYVNGDLCGGATAIYTNGEVTQSLNVFANKVHHTGLVGGSIRACAYSLTVDGRVDRSVMAFAYDTHIGRGAVIGRDANLFGLTVRVDGQIGQDLNIKADRVVIAGSVGGDVDVEAKHISIIPPATIGGDLNYTCAEEITIDTAGGVIIAGEVKRIIPEESDEEQAAGATLEDFVFPLAKMLAAFFFGVILVALFRRYAEVTFTEIRNRFVVSFAAGMLLLLILTVAVIILVIAILGLVVGLMLVSGDTAVLGAAILVLSFLSVPITAFASVSGGVMFYAGKIVVASLIGYLFVRIFKQQPRLLGAWQLLFGLIVLTLVFLIPYAGFALYVLVSLTGAGAIMLGIRKCRPSGEQPLTTGVEPPNQP